MSDPVDLAAARWDRADDPQQLTPLDALKAVVRAIEAGDIDPAHLIVAVALPQEGCRAQTMVYQAGSYPFHAQLGLLTRAAQILPGEPG